MNSVATPSRKRMAKSRRRPGTPLTEERMADVVKEAPSDGYAVNPLREGLDSRAVPDPATVVIFGITGDLAARNLIPAIYNLAADGFLPTPFTVVGVGRRDWTDDFLRSEMRKNV